MVSDSVVKIEIYAASFTSTADERIECCKFLLMFRDDIRSFQITDRSTIDFFINKIAHAKTDIKYKNRDIIDTRCVIYATSKSGHVDTFCIGKIAWMEYYLHKNIIKKFPDKEVPMFIDSLYWSGFIKK